ncbi:MAG: PCRF domain-containing protein, partial [Actinomycetota bacterium]|nr:PCRF domain-containing protein [Actinomycetota bacterium]
MKDFSDELAALSQRLSDSSSVLDQAGKAARLSELEKEASVPDLWDDPDSARLVTTEMARIKDDLDVLGDLSSRLEEAHVLFQLSQEEADDSVEAELSSLVSSLETDLSVLELRSLFTGEHDDRDAVCEVHAGAGGT